MIGTGRRRMMPSAFSLALVVASLATGILTQVGGTLLASSSGIDESPWDRCVGFQVGSQQHGTTHVHLENIGRERISIGLYFIDIYGSSSQFIDHPPFLDPGASADLAFRTPSLGAEVLAVSSARKLQGTAEIVHDDGADSERRRAFMCLPPRPAAGP